MPTETTPQPETITVGPFTWVRDQEPSRNEEMWILQDAVEMIGMHWWCKNYGTQSRRVSPFNGWRCGSGGPWPTLYKSREDAMNRVIPYLIECMRNRLQNARAAVAKREAILAKALGWQFRNEKNS